MTKLIKQPKLDELYKHRKVLVLIAKLFKGKCMYKAIHHFLQDIDFDVSDGTINKFFKTYYPKLVYKNYNYGNGSGAVQGRIHTDKFTCKKGETYVRKNNKWIKEYQAIMVKELTGKNQDLVVHHKNCIHTDNRKSNLQVMTRKEHTLLHNYLKYKEYLKQKKGISI